MDGNTPAVSKDVRVPQFDVAACRDEARGRLVRHKPGARTLLAPFLAAAMLLAGGLLLLGLPVNAGAGLEPLHDARDLTGPGSLRAATFAQVPITITTGGLTPRVVTVSTCTPVQWTNMTTATQTIVAGVPIKTLYLPLVVRGLNGPTTGAGGHVSRTSTESTDWGGEVPPHRGTYAHTFSEVGIYPYHLAADASISGTVWVMNLTNYSIDDIPPNVVSRGGQATYIVQIVDRGSQTSSVGLDVSDAQGGISFSWSANPATPSEEVVLTVEAASDAPLGAHHLTVTGDDGCLQRSVATTLYVMDPAVSNAYLPAVLFNLWPGIDSQWRFGFGVNENRGQIADYDVAKVRAGWYHDWGVKKNPSRPAGLEYMQTVSVNPSPTCAQLAPYVASNPGSWWFIGSEPDNNRQGNRTPEEYANIYHELYWCIKMHDPSAKLAPGGITQATPLRLQYLDLVQEAYQLWYGDLMPADGWHIHNQTLRERSCEAYPDDCWGARIPPGISATDGMLYEIQDNDSMPIFRSHLVAFREWMQRNGYQDKPLFVSEYGIGMPAMYGFDTDRVIKFMTATFHYMLGAKDCSLGYPADDCRLVQRWAWYSLNDKMYDPACTTDCGFNGNLFDPDTLQLTDFGVAYGNRLNY